MLTLMKSPRLDGVPTNFTVVPLDSLSKNRRGKHRLIVSKILSDLEKLPPGSALRIPRNSLSGQKLVNVRSALNRATRALDLRVCTSTDDENFYVWKT